MYDVMKTVEERNDIDLLELAFELRSRALMFPTKEMHDAYLEARQEIERRIVAYQNQIPYTDEIVFCSKCSGPILKSAVKNELIMTKKNKRNSK